MHVLLIRGISHVFAYQDHVDHLASLFQHLVSLFRSLYRVLWTPQQPVQMFSQPVPLAEMFSVEVLLWQEETWGRQWVRRIVVAGAGVWAALSLAGLIRLGLERKAPAGMQAPEGTLYAELLQILRLAVMMSVLIGWLGSPPAKVLVALWMSATAMMGSESVSPQNGLGSTSRRLVHGARGRGFAYCHQQCQIGAV